MNQLPERDLPPGRHRLLKEHLMTEIRRPDEAPARPRRRWRRPALVAGTVAAVTAVALTVAVPVGGDSPAPPSSATVALLEDIALAAEHQDGRYGEIRDDQFVYIDSQVSYSRTGEGMKTKIPPLHRQELWVTVDGDHTGLKLEEGEKPMWIEPDVRRGGPGWEVSSFYRHLETLPTDPDAMYDYLRETAPEYSGQEPDQAMFELVGQLMRNAIVPPAQAAALYRAVARIPGVTVVEHAVDAAGRQGVAIARQDPDNDIRDEWIFDEETHEFLGERSVASADWSDVEEGTVVSNTAVLRRAVVDKPGQRP
ncbi:CU044_5270 family protein [Streptomyces pharetrae]|uniref:CU044_5270 family protein n=1 Tax=Streptomyces pharetrae TaxID=291370 RepID=UPI003648D341